MFACGRQGCVVNANMGPQLASSLSGWGRFLVGNFVHTHSKCAVRRGARAQHEEGCLSPALALFWTKPAGCSPNIDHVWTTRRPETVGCSLRGGLAQVGIAFYAARPPAFIMYCCRGHGSFKPPLATSSASAVHVRRTVLPTCVQVDSLDEQSLAPSLTVADCTSSQVTPPPPGLGKTKSSLPIRSRPSGLRCPRAYQPGGHCNFWAWVIGTRRNWGKCCNLEVPS